jgi:hypothetical protein
MRTKTDAALTAEELVQRIVTKSFGQKIDQETLETVAHRVSLAIPKGLKSRRPRRRSPAFPASPTSRLS